MTGKAEELWGHHRKGRGQRRTWKGGQGCSVDISGRAEDHGQHYREKTTGNIRGKRGKAGDYSGYQREGRETFGTPQGPPAMGNPWKRNLLNHGLTNHHLLFLYSTVDSHLTE